MQLGSHLRASLWFLLRASSNPRQSFFGIGFDFIYGLLGMLAFGCHIGMMDNRDAKREAAFSNCTTPVGRLLAVAVGVDLAVPANSPLLSRSLEAQELDFAFAFSSQLRGFSASHTPLFLENWRSLATVA